MPPTLDSHPDAVVFDLDGVLLDTTENMRLAFAATWTAAGRDGEAPFAEFLTHMGAPLPRILGLLGLPETLTDVYSAESRRHLGLVEAYPGVRELLSALKAAGTPVAIATGKSHERAMLALRSAGLDGDIDVVIGSDLVGRPKPAPDIVHTALARLRASTGKAIDPRRTLFVGDSVLDMRAGTAAGVVVVAAGWGQTAPEILRAEGPDGYAARVADLFGVLGLPTPSSLEVNLA
ncbi:HAD-IA family hydrolase [Amycolatopsis orientalis]|uniref:HAD-IA family hydrolase n=1 Tax=Amycolatopsis orientalis TaxID=31958 RepID=UPI00069899CF|nr:HAD-IA family hydrolase [Amycolatopsis orientalis]